eukprot:gene9884-18474_t
MAKGYSLMSLNNLNECIQSAAICNNCKSPKSRLSLLEVKAERKGLAQKLVIQCNLCSSKSNFSTSSKSGAHEPFEVNVRSAHGTSSQGLGHAGLTRLCASLDLPKPIHHKPYDKIIRDLSGNAQRLAERKMMDAAAKLVQITKEEDPSNIEESSEGQIIANVAVTVDAVCETVCEFNTGAASLEEILNESKIKSTSNSLIILRDMDSKRLKNAAKKVSSKARLQRRKLRAKRKGAVEKATSYISGAFGLHKTPELDLHKGFEIIYQQSETVEPEIKFIDEKNILLVKVETLQ